MRMINPINFLMNRFGLKRTTSVVATTVVATALMYNAYKAYNAKLGQQVIQDLKAYKTYREIREQQEIQDLKAYKVIQEQQVVQDLKAYKA